jgi:methyl-accepting chemotaxis protein
MSDYGLPELGPKHGFLATILAAVVWLLSRAPWRKGAKTYAFLDTVMERFDKFEQRTADQAEATQKMLATMTTQMSIASELARNHTHLATSVGEVMNELKDVKKDFNGLGMKLSRVEQAGHDNTKRIEAVERDVELLEYKGAA